LGPIYKKELKENIEDV